MVTNITNMMHVFESRWNIIIEILLKAFVLNSNLAIECGQLIII